MLRSTSDETHFVLSRITKRLVTGRELIKNHGLRLAVDLHPRRFMIPAATVPAPWYVPGRTVTVL